MALFTSFSLKSTSTKARPVLTRTLFASFPSQSRSTEPTDLTPLSRVEGLGERLSRIVKEIDEAETRSHRTRVPKKSPMGHDPYHLSDAPLWSTTQVEISHPWPEWISLIDCLVQGNHFAEQVGSSQKGGLFGDSFDVMPHLDEENRQSFIALTRAFANFTRHRFELIRHLSRRDIQILVGSGCPTVNPKVVASSKRMRAFVHVDEGDVCSKCNLRGSCTMSFSVPSLKETAKTIDVLRILFMHSYAPRFPSSNESRETKVTVNSVRKLVGQVVEFSKFPHNVFEQNPSHTTQKVGRDDIEMKKGDWLCPKCEFMNFAKNKRCLQCRDPAPRRKLKPGEWECLGCGYANYRRNMVCYKCESNRPKESGGFPSFCSSDDGKELQRYTGWKWKKQINEGELDCGL